MRRARASQARKRERSDARRRAVAELEALDDADAADAKKLLERAVKKTVR
jgi:hypothetical protein